MAIEARGSPPLELFQTRQDTAMSNLSTSGVSPAGIRGCDYTPPEVLYIYVFVVSSVIL